MAFSKNRTVLIVLACAALALGIVFLFLSTGPDESAPEVSATPAAEYFIAQTQAEMVAQIGQPIEGFEQMMFMATYPGLTEADFEGVETFGDQNGPNMQTSADASITQAGMMRLLENVASRAQLPMQTQADIDAILAFMADPQNE